MTTPVKRSGSKTILTLSVTLLMVGLGIVYVIFSDQDMNAQASKHSAIDRGGKIYAEHCASCHGVNLEGEPNWTKRNADGTMPAPPHDATGHTWHHSDEILFKLTKFGLSALVGGDYRTNMPVYKDVLSDEEIVDVLTFIKSTWPEEIREAQERMSN